jgi:hypothetical protein
MIYTWLAGHDEWHDVYIDDNALYIHWHSAWHPLILYTMIVFPDGTPNINKQL